MSGNGPTGRRPGETFDDYLDRARARVAAVARERSGETTPADAPPPPAEPVRPPQPAVAHSPAAHPAETADAAREARRRGVVAAIARDEEPAGGFKPVSVGLPPSVQAAAGLRVERVRILKADVPASLPRRTPKAPFMARVREVVKGLAGHGVSERCLEDVAEACLYFEEKRGGFAQVGLNAIATVARYCARHVQRALHLLEGGGLFDVLNVPYREGDEWWRDANIYVATMDEEPAPLPADVEGPDPVLPASTSRALGGASRLAALFGLVLRAGGLNTSPAHNYRTRTAPA